MQEKEKKLDITEDGKNKARKSLEQYGNLYREQGRLRNEMVKVDAGIKKAKEVLVHEGACGRIQAVLEELINEFYQKHSKSPLIIKEFMLSATEPGLAIRVYELFDRALGKYVAKEEFDEHYHVYAAYIERSFLRLQIFIREELKVKSAPIEFLKIHFCKTPD